MPRLQRKIQLKLYILNPNNYIALSYGIIVSKRKRESNRKAVTVLKIYNLKCPNCGATLSTDVKNNRARCEYCGNEFYIAEAKENDAKQPERNEKTDDVQAKQDPQQEQVAAVNRAAGDAEENDKSHFRDFIIVFFFIMVGVALSLLFDKKAPQDIVPKTDLHRFFMELRLDSTPQDIETLAQKHKLHFFRTEKAVNSDTANIIYYKIAKTNETALDKQGEHGETVEIEFDAIKNNAFRLAVYADPEHIVSRAILFKYGTYYSLSAEDTKAKDVAGYYYYNNSLRSAAGELKTHPPYLKCADAVEALKNIYTYKK